MTQRFRAALVVLVVLAVGTLAVWFVLGGAGNRAGDSASEIARGGGEDGPDGQPILRPGTPTGSGNAPVPNVPLGPGLPNGVSGLPQRTPNGPDYTDPAVNQKLALQALGDSPPDWARVAQLLAVHDGPLSEGVRRALLEAISAGDRAGALRVFAVMRDGTMVRDVFDLIDRRDLTAGARNALFHALSLMPGANAAEVVQGLEARLTGVGRKDLVLLQAIGRRGGREAARAVVEYLLRSDVPLDLPNRGYLGLDLTSDPSAAEIVAAAYGQATTPEALRALIRLSAQPGAHGLVDSLIALDHGEQSSVVRKEVIEAIGRIGSEQAVDYLLRLGSQPGVFGEEALENLGRMRVATPEARVKLVEALGNAGGSPDPDVARRELLQALGNLREESALGAMVESIASPNLEIRMTAVRGIGQIGEAARQHVTSLIDLFAVSAEPMQRTVAVALGGVGGAEAISALEQMAVNTELSPQVIRTANSALKLARRSAAQQPADSGTGPILGGG